MDVSAGGDHLIEDGSDAAAWARVRVWTAYLAGAGEEAEVQLDELWNEIAGDDVTAAEATSGDTTIFSTLTLENQSPMTITELTAWLDASAGATSLLELSDSSGGPWSSPTTEGAGIALGGLAPSGTTTLHVRRTIGAGASADPDLLAHFHLSWKGL